MINVFLTSGYADKKNLEPKLHFNTDDSRQNVFRPSVSHYTHKKGEATRIASVFPNRKDFVRMFHAHRGFEMSNDIS